MAPPLHEAFHKHCVAFERVKDKSNVCRWHCKYCGRIQTSSVTRLLIHLCKLGGECSTCNGIPDDVYEECRKKNLPLKRRKGSLPQHEVVSPDHEDIGIGNAPSISIGSAAPTMSSHECEEGTSLPKRNKGVCESGSGSSRQPTLAQVSGGVSRTLAFLKERQRVAEIEIARTIIECNLPFNVLRLDRWRRMIRAIANVGPCEGWYGVSYNDMRTKKLDEEKARIDKSLEPRGIINILVSCPLGTYFLRAVDAGVRGKKVTGSFIYSHIRHTILEVSHQHVIQVITDNASNCASMGRKLEQEFPSIVWSPCATHCLDLLMEDIGKLEWVKSITSEAISIVDFINAKTVVSEEFKEWLDGEPIAQQQEAKAMQRLCLKESFWRSVHGLVIAILPLYKVLRMTDMEGCHFHFLKSPFMNFRYEAKSTPKRDDLLYLIEKRWKWMKRPIHGFAALLHPTFKEPSLFMDTSLLEDRDTYLPKILSTNDHGKFLQDFINYNDQRDSALASSLVWKRDSLVKPLFWWESFGYQMPTLQRCAMRVLAQDCSSGACERNWSAYSLIHTKIHNKLSTKQLERLIYCRSNLRMLRSMHEMPMARQVNVDSLKLSLETLKGIQRERNEEEERIFSELYLELEEIDRRVSHTRSHSKVIVRGSRSRQRHGSSNIAYSRRGSSSRSTPSAMEEENVVLDTDLREPSYDDDGNILSDGDYENASTASSIGDDGDSCSDHDS
ncbi:hypothetical protein KP509_35G045900 [Ceratopteris richardii]|uniref:Uncharacterized protein n=1 Tax=Ceratopteris richardii TaxID=49495 RepID=A0A8T2QF14_CERRI|nr:hypothetical protein KP509_35G045900 [Ceratopteris richardii]